MRQGAREAKVANRDSTLLVYQNVGGLEITMDDVGRMKEFYATQ